MKRFAAVFGLALASLSFTDGAGAADAVTTFSVGATVTEACTVSASDLAFGDIDPLANATAATDAATGIAITCAKGTVYDIALDGGASAATTARAMINGAAELNYALYSDAARTANWGNTAGTDTVGDTGTGAQQTLTVYGRVPSGQQTVPAGTYADTITVVVSY